MIPTFALLTLAILALWADRPGQGIWIRRLWLVPFAGSLVAAMTLGIVRPIGLGWVLAFAVVAWGFGQAFLPVWPRRIAGALVLLLGGALISHQLPGFNNPLAIPSGRLTPDAVPYRLHFNFDKTVVGLFLLAWCHARIASAAEWRRVLARAAPVAAATIALLVGLALAVGYVRFAPKFPAEAWLWLWANLVFTCVAEEAVFRGLVQAQLARVWHRIPRGEWLALMVAAVLFGVAHIGGGLAYVVLATIAGIGYGWAYLRTGRLEASILCHFALNAVHFLGYTYPALAR